MGKQRIHNPELTEQEQHDALYCLTANCCSQSDASEVVRKKKPTDSLDDEAWCVKGRDGRWWPIKMCPFCGRSLG